MPLDPIARLLNAARNPEFYNLEMTVGMFLQFDEDAKEVIEGKLISEDDKVYLPLQKKYSLSVDNEIDIDLSTVDKAPTDKLIKLIEQIAEAENKSVKSVEKTVKMMFDNELDIKKLPIDWICYHEVLMNAYYEVMFGAKNQKVVVDVLRNRGVKLQKDTVIPMLFLRELNVNFIAQERNGWIEPEDEAEGDGGKLSDQVAAIKAEIQQLTGTVSGLTSRIGELESIDTKAIKSS